MSVTLNNLLTRIDGVNEQRHNFHLAEEEYPWRKAENIGGMILGFLGTTQTCLCIPVYCFYNELNRAHNSEFEAKQSVVWANWEAILDTLRNYPREGELLPLAPLQLQSWNTLQLSERTTLLCYNASLSNLAAKTQAIVILHPHLVRIPIDKRVIEGKLLIPLLPSDELDVDELYRLFTKALKIAKEASIEHLAISIAEEDPMPAAHTLIDLLKQEPFQDSFRAVWLSLPSWLSAERVAGNLLSLIA